MPFGSALRLLRVDAGISLRGLAQRIGVSSTYLSRVENGLDPVPTPDRLSAIADVLDVSPTLLLDLAHQVGSVVTDYLERVPAANALFVDLARRNLGPADIARLRAYLDREFPARSVAAAVSLRELLTVDRIVLRFVGGDLGDVIDAAAARLARGNGARELAERIRAREEQSSTALGESIAVPHAIIEGATPGAVLVTLARPLTHATPDALPLRVVVVLVSGRGGHEHLERLAHVARIASHGLVEDLASAHHPREVLETLATVDERRPRRARKSG